jgi:outer membrane protein OmpA-like peptidoglycan-associated protein
MKTKDKFMHSLTMKGAAIAALLLAGMQAPVQAQDKYSKPSWWFGGAAAGNFNFYRGSTQKLNSDVMAPVAFHAGKGLGLYVAPVLEFHRPDSRWGMMLQAGYDSRKGTFKEAFSPCNCPRDLSTRLRYITIEPSLRFAPFKSNFYLFGGARLALNVGKSFTYQEKANPDYPAQTDGPKVKGDLSDVKKMLVSMQIGAGYDIPLSPQDNRTQYVLSPFISYHPYFGQSPRTIETWSMSTLRVGVILKLGRGKKLPVSAEVAPVVGFSVNSPKNIPVQRRVRETFPLRNYVFFNLGSNEIPDRYVLLNKNQVKDFKEDQLEVFAPKKLSGRSAREMTVYYNVLNILGDRLEKNPSSGITLVGSSEKGPEEGKEMAESVKKYLVTVFDINASRIAIEGRNKPKIPSEHPGGMRALELLREGDRRVSIESSSPDLLMEFQSGPTASLKPVEIVGVQEAPLDSYVSFRVDPGKEEISSWALEVQDGKGQVQNFGPYKQKNLSLPGKSIMGSTPEGDYKITMVVQTKNGKTIRKDTSVHMVLWKPAENEEGMRFSVIYEFNDSKAIKMYEKYLTEVVAPKIPQGGKVIIHGYTDNIGEEAHNLKLSTDRANDVKTIIENALSKAGRKDVKFEVLGFGEDQNLSPFENKYPEERFYNRTVVIDIIPGK